MNEVKPTKLGNVGDFRVFSEISEIYPKYSIFCQHFIYYISRIII